MRVAELVHQLSLPNIPLRIKMEDQSSLELVFMGLVKVFVYCYKNNSRVQILDDNELVEASSTDGNAPGLLRHVLDQYIVYVSNMLKQAETSVYHNCPVSQRESLRLSEILQQLLQLKSVQPLRQL